jgi:filamentous hemagglutinin family protein
MKNSGDGTMLNNSSLTPDGSTINITGGTRAGSNLFYSFSDFSVPTGTEAIFNNAVDIQNIITTVTGESVSNIDGIIRTLGSANLFLINPNGIVFGSNARLDIDGSLIGSTASSISFADGFEFSATNPQAPPSLTTVPTGLQYGTSPGSIQVIGDSQATRLTSELIDTENALRVEPNQTLALVGGDINIDGGALKTAGGRIELGSVEGEAQVSLTPIDEGFSLTYDKVQNFGNIKLSQQATVDASGSGGGDIQVIGKQVTLEDGSVIETSTLGAQSGGTLNVIAKESLEVIGKSENGQFPSALNTQVYPSAQGDGGDLWITTKSLVVQDGAQISASTSGAGSAGNLTVSADKVELTRVGSVNGSASGLFTQANLGATQSAGDLGIYTKTLRVRDGAQVGAIDTQRLQIHNRAQVNNSTSDAGSGGNITINAGSVKLIGVNSVDGSGSALSAPVNSSTTGNGGELTITTGGLSVRDGAQLTANTSGAKNGGIIEIKAPTLLQNGAQLTASTSGASSGGNITINTTSLVLMNMNVEGTLGRDTLSGTSDNDRIAGLQGADILTGGGGNDVFIYNSIRDAGDRITDFQVGADVISLSRSLFQAPSDFNYDIATNGGFLGFRTNGSDTTILIDPDGTSGSLVFTPLTTLSGVAMETLANANNFVL